MKKLIIIVILVTAFSCKTQIIKPLVLNSFETSTLSIEENLDSISISENCFKISIDKTTEKALIAFLGQPDDICKRYACGQTTEIKKTFFGERRKTYGSGFSTSQFIYKRYAVAIELSKHIEGETSVVTGIEIFHPIRLDAKNSKQQINYDFDCEFNSVEKSTMIKTFGNSFKKYAINNTQCYDYNTICFIFNEKEDKFLGIYLTK